MTYKITIKQYNDTDGAWKYALEIMLFEFLQLFMPNLYDQIDTCFKPESKETELKELLPNLKPKHRIVDKLVRVKYKNGKNAFLMIHIEIESKTNTYKQQQHFAARMYDYYTMISTRYKNHEIVNIGVLINSKGLITSDGHLVNKKYHQDFLVYKLVHPIGQTLQFKFPVIHLARWIERKEELKTLAYTNPFAIMVLYQLVVLKYKNKNKRLNAKVQIIRLGSQYGYSPEMIRILMYLADWIITLPEELQYEYYEEVKKMEAEVQERFVSIYEIMGKKEGLVNMLIKLLNHKFNNIPDAIIDRINSANLEQIEVWSLNLLNAKTIDEVFDE